MLAYTIKSAIYLSIMYIPYMLLLRKESFFTFNRILLLCIMLLSLILPLCDIHSLSWSHNPIPQGMIQVGIPFAVVGDTAMGNDAAVSDINWLSLLGYIYVAGVVAAAIYKFVQLVYLARAINHGVLWKETKNGVTIYCHANEIVSFSWFRAIVLSEKDYNENATEILRHEMGHITHHHSWDILLLNIVETIQWYNPLVWILAASLRDVHEYEADDAVLRSGINARQYQSLLIRKAVGSSSYTFANSFNHSLLKKRITMMLQKKSNPWMRTKALYIIPVAVIALSAFATPELNNRIDAIAEQAMPSVIADKGTTNSSTLQENTQENIAALVEQDDIKEENDSVVLYIVGGKVVSRAECLSVSPNDIKAMTIVKDQDEIKKYTDNKRVKQAIIVELKSKDDDTDNAYGKVERAPQFPGGMEAMMKYVADNIKYPESAKKQGLGGRVIVEFYVEKDGSISEVKTKSFKSNSYNEGNYYKDEVKEKAVRAERKVAEAKEKAARAERKVAEAKEKTARAK